MACPYGCKRKFSPRKFLSLMTDTPQSQFRELQMATSQPLGFAVQHVVTLIAALALAIFYAWDVTLVTLATVPLSASLMAIISLRVQLNDEAQNGQLSAASKLVQTAITSIDTVKCLNGELLELRNYRRIIDKAARFYLNQAQTNGLQIGLARFTILVMFVQGFWYGSHLVNKGKRQPGDVLTAFWATLVAVQTVEQILPQFLVLEKGRAASAALQVQLWESTSDQGPSRTLKNKEPRFCEGDMELRDVDFT